MKTVYKTFIAFTLTLIVVGCEEVIEIDLNSVNPVIVAEGVVEKDSSAWLQLSYSADYFNPEESDKIENATVRLIRDDGHVEILEHISEGRYSGVEKAAAGQGYTLEFEVEGTSYSASSYIHSASEILSIEFNDMGHGRPGESVNYLATVLLRDEPLVDNYYMLKLTVNDEHVEGNYFLADDKTLNNNGIITYMPMTPFQAGDSVRINLYSIDEAAYIYYSHLVDNSRGFSASSTPFNPTSNFGEDVMGFFVGRSGSEFEVQVE